MGIQDRKEGRIFNMFRGLGPQNGICDELFPTFEKEENLLSNTLCTHTSPSQYPEKLNWELRILLYLFCTDLY